jgi:hypothetical protein
MPPAVDRLKNLPPLPPPQPLPRVTPEEQSLMDARLVAHMDEMLAHLGEPLPEGEPDWDPETLFAPDRVR